MTPGLTFTRVSDADAASVSYGTNMSLSQAVARCIESGSGILTPAIVDAYNTPSGVKRGIIHCCGNFVSEDALVECAQEGILKWYAEKYDWHYLTKVVGNKYRSTASLNALGVALLRLKIIDEKYWALHYANDRADESNPVPDQRLVVRGFPLTYRAMVASNDAFRQHVEQNIYRLDNVMNEIIAAIIVEMKSFRAG